MRNATPCVLYTFATTTDAMHMESAACAAALPGRLVPVPGFVRAGCGLCWRAAPAERETVRAFLAQGAIPYEREVDTEL